MARGTTFQFREKPKKKRPGIHSKTKKKKMKYRGEGR